MDISQLRTGRLILLILVVAFLTGAAVQAVRTIPDPDLFGSGTGTIVSGAVTGAVLVALVSNPPAWLKRHEPPGSAPDR